MDEVTLPPSPNWYLSNIIACSVNGTVVWGTGNMLIVGKPNKDDKTLQYSIIKYAHATKVTCVAFASQIEDQCYNYLATVGVDNTLKIWNTETLSMVYAHQMKANVQLIAVDWSYKEPNVIRSVTSDGYALSWNIHFKAASLIALGNMTPTCIACCPHDPYLVAIGSKSGLVYIVSFQGKGNVVYKLRRHDADIINLSWCPSEDNVLNGSMNKDFLLASSGKDRSITIWKAGSDGRYEMIIPVSTGPLDPQQKRNKLNTSIGNWIVVNWIEPKLLLTSSAWGELISWDLSKIKKGKPTATLVHAYHNRGLFCIAHVPNNQIVSTEGDGRKQRVWTSAQDRRVICCGIQEHNLEIEYDIYTQGGCVYCIAACPLDTSQVAFGAGDAMLRLWNLSESHTTSCAITVLWKKILGKIRAVSWHPEKENLLAYATEEGRIGVFNMNANKPPTLCRQYHRSIVYSIGWGPNEENKYVLYSCSEGELVYCDLDKPNEDPISVLKKECTEFSWKPDFSCLAVGFHDGSISLLNKKLQLCGRIKFASVMVYTIAWHPESTATDTSFSPLRNYIAVACKSHLISIYDLSNFIDHMTNIVTLTETDATNYTPDVYKVHEIVTTLIGHVQDVVCLAWSPFISGQLVSGSYDGIAQVWNVEMQKTIATYKGHGGPVLCCMWSPLNPDYVITGSLDKTVRIWKISNNTTQEKPQELPGNLKKPQVKTQKTVDSSVLNNVTKWVGDISKCSISHVSPTTKTSEITMVKDTQKKKVRKSYFAKSGNVSTNDTLKSILNVVKSMKDENVSINENKDTTMVPVLFSTKENFMSFLSKERDTHMRNGKYDCVTEMEMWSNDLEQSLNTAAKEARLNDFLVSLSASLSTKKWRHICEMYAEQLIAEGNPYKAVSYCLCIHKIYKAIDVYQTVNLYKEAYVLARCKLESDDPILVNVLKNWATYAVNTGNYETAAYVYAKLGDFSEIVKYLSRRKHAETLVAAAEIALLCNDDDTSKSLIEKAVFTAFLNSEYNTARKIIEEYPYLKYQETYLSTLEELEKIVKEDLNENTIGMWVNNRSEYGLLQALESVSQNDGSYLEQFVKNNICDILESERTLILAVGLELALAVTSSCKELKLKHIVTALHTINQYETMNRNKLECSLLTKVAIRLDSKSLSNENSIYAKSEYSVSDSLRAFLCYSLLNWFVYNINKEHKDSNIETYVNLIENLLEDALNKQCVEWWSITFEINKLEHQVASAVCKTTVETEENKDDNQLELLMDKLNEMKAKRKKFIDKTVGVPNPVMVYSGAIELCSKLLDESLRNKFHESITKIWMNATG